jgi:hypothetical protein
MTRREVYDQVLVRLYEAGELYDTRCSGGDRTLHLERADGHWVASWRNGPFDCYRHDEADATPMQAVERLTAWVEEDNLTGESGAA